MGWWTRGPAPQFAVRSGASSRHVASNPDFATWPTGQYIPTADDPWAPNFTRSPNIISVQSGNWSSASTWNLGRAPQAGDTVVVRTTHTVTYDANATTAYSGVGIAGSLVFRTDIDTQLWATNIIVYTTGLLQIGTVGTPVTAGKTAQLVVRDVAVDTGTDPAQYGTGVLIQGMLTGCGQTKTSGNYTRLVGSAASGATSLTLDSSPSGWNNGDDVIVTDSQLAIDPATWSTAHPRFRTTISSISGTALTLNAGLNADRPTAVDHTGAAETDMTAHVANLTRNVIFRSENPSGTCGHLMVMGHSSSFDCRYMEFKLRGRTTGSALDDTTFDGSGNPTHVGTNQRGRYNFHCHHLGGSGATRSTLKGCSFWPDTNGDHTAKWGITVHETNYLDVSDNVVWNWIGAGIAVEDGSEHHNVFEHNLICYVMGGPGAGSRADTGFPGREGDGYWAQTGYNYVRNNSCCNCYLHGFTVFNDGGQINYGVGGYLQFDGNETYAGRNGMTNWYLNGADTGLADPDAARTYVDNFKAWHNWDNPMYGIGYPIYNITWRSAKVRGGTNTTRTGTGFYGGDYQHRGVALEDCDIQNCVYGIQIPLTDSAANVFAVSGGTLYNNYNIYLPTQQNSGSGGWTPTDRYATFTDVALDGFFTAAVFMQYSIAYDKTRLRNIDDLRIYNYAGGSTDYRIWFNEQDESQVMPQSNGGTGLEACPEAGLTNAQAYAKYHQDGTLKVPLGSTSDPEGCCIAGALMPGGASTVAWLTGGKVTTI